MHIIDVDTVVSSGEDVPEGIGGNLVHRKRRATMVTCRYAHRKHVRAPRWTCIGSLVAESDKAEFHILKVNAINNMNSSLIKLHLKLFSVAGFALFDGLLNLREWLTDTHCDILLNVLLYKASLHPDKYLKDWTVLEYPV